MTLVLLCIVFLVGVKVGLEIGNYLCSLEDK